MDKLGLEEFFLVGHSFGGYISSLITLKYKYMVKALILLSPVGLSSNYSPIESTPIEDLLQSISYSTKSPPSELFNTLGYFSNFLFDFIFRRKLQNLDNQVNLYIKFINLFIGRNSCNKRILEMFIF